MPTAILAVLVYSITIIFVVMVIVDVRRLLPPPPQFFLIWGGAVLLWLIFGLLWQVKEAKLERVSL